MIFYQQCFGGQLSFQTIQDVEGEQELPVEMRGNILQATLLKDDLLLLATDMLDESLVKGNAVSMLLNCSSATEIKRYHKQLSVGAKSVRALQETAEGAVFGQLTDRFGNQWLLSYDQRN